MKKLICSILLCLVTLSLFAVSSPAEEEDDSLFSYEQEALQEDRLDVGLGLGLSILGLEVDLELRKNTFDFQTGLSVLLITYTPTVVSNVDGEASAGTSSGSSSASFTFISKNDLGAKWDVGRTKTNSIGTGAASVTAVSTDFKSFPVFVEILGMYFKYGHTFDFGLELGAEVYLPVALMSFTDKSFFYYTVCHPYGLPMAMSMGLYGITLEIKYHF